MQTRSPSQRGIYYLVFVFQLLLVVIAAKFWRGSSDSPTPRMESNPPATAARQAETRPWPAVDVSWVASPLASDVAIPEPQRILEPHGYPFVSPKDRLETVEDPFETPEGPFDTGDYAFETPQNRFGTSDYPFETREDPFDTSEYPFETREDFFDTCDYPFEALEGLFDTGDCPFEDLEDLFETADYPFERTSVPVSDPYDLSSEPEVVAPLASKTPVPVLPEPKSTTLPQSVESQSEGPPSSYLATASPRPPVLPQPALPESLGTAESSESVDQPTGPPTASSPWSAPAAMVAPLQQLAEFAEFAPWANAVRWSLGEVLRSSELADERLAKSFSDLERLGRREVSLDASPGAALQRQLAYSVRRRVGLWKAVHEASRRVDPDRAYRDPVWIAERCEGMSASLDALEIALDARQSGDAWRGVFRVQELREFSERCSPGELSAQQQLAHEVLDQLDAMKRFRGADPVWQLPAMVQFIERLHVWAIEPISLSEFLDTMEGFEMHPAELAARDLARTTRGLLASDQEPHRQIGSYLETHYRNANLRLVLSDRLINRFLPTVPATIRPVRDSMFGAQISGQSHNTTRLTLRAEPDSDAWNLHLGAQGLVSSTTTARKGPVVTYDQGKSEFAATKPVVVDQSGVHLGRTQVTADGQTRLRKLETRLDKIPILGFLVRRLAREEHAKKLPIARRLFASRVAGQVRGEVDQEITAQLKVAEQAYSQRVRQPLADLALDPRSLQLSTTADRKLMVRYRLAADNQLGAFTARPRALADSLMSLQVHQSTLNNMVQQLGLAGRHVELSQLLLEIADRLQLANFQLPDDLPEDVMLKFAASDPLRLEFHDGRATVRVRLAELSAGRRRWRNFEARAHYAPQVRGVQVAMQRADSVQLLGPRLSFRDQVALRGIFTKVFSQNREFPLVNPEIIEHPALAQTRLSQLEIRDGWIGLSLSDAAPVTASRPATDKR